MGAAGAGVRRAAAGITGEGPVMMRGAWALAAKEKAKAAIEEKVKDTQIQEKRKKNMKKEMSKERKPIIIKNKQLTVSYLAEN